MEMSAPVLIPSMWLYTFAVQMLPMAEGGGLVGVYRVRFWNRGSGVTLLGRPGGCGGGLKSRTSDGGRVGVIDRSALRYWAGRVEFIKRA